MKNQTLNQMMECDELVVLTDAEIEFASGGILPGGCYGDIRIFKDWRMKRPSGTPLTMKIKTATMSKRT